MKKLKYLVIFVAFAAIFSLKNTYAITIPELSNITSQVNPGLIQKRLSDNPILPAKKVGGVQAPVEPTTAATSAEAKIHFKLTKVIIKGNTVYSEQALQNIFESSINKNISVADLQNMVNKITILYRSSGYILSRAFLPEQVIKNGVVQVQIVEGFISKVEVSGNPGKVSRILNVYGQNITASHPLQMKVLERNVLLMNDLPGVNTKAVITPSKTVQSAADLNLVTEQQKVNAYLSYDNYGTRYLGPQEIGVGVTGNSLTFPGASDTIRLMTVPKTSEMEFIEYVHTHPIGSNGGNLTLGGNYTNTVPQFVLAPFDIVGRSQLVYLTYNYPWIRSRSENFSTFVTGNYNNVSSTILGGPFYNDLIRSLVFGGDYNAIDRWRGINDVKIDVEKGFNIMGAQQHLLQSRPNGVPNFLKLEASMSRLQALPWNLSILAAMQGQYSFEPLLATEQYAFGGPIYGRGYNPSEIVGDDAFAAKLELRKDQYFDKAFLNAVQWYLFYDAGIVWNRDGVNLFPKQSATSIGLGARVTIIKNLTANVYYAKPLTHSISTQVLMGKDPFKPGIFFQLVASY